MVVIDLYKNDITSEEDKNEARQARPDGLNGSISMDRTKGKPISCIGPLRVKHYEKIRTQ